MAIKKIKLPDNSEQSLQDSRLPDVTSSDNGKVLSVSSGAWAASTKPSYTLDEVSDGSTRKLADYLPLSGGNISGTIWRKITADTSNYEDAIGWRKHADNTKLASIGYINDEQKIYLNSIGASNIWNDTAGKYSFVVGNNLLTYNTNAILHAGNYASYALPLSAGSGYPLTGDLYLTTGKGIEDSSNNGLLVYHPTNWTGISNTQWGVGANDSQGVIRSDNSDLLHTRSGTAYTIYDSGNSNKSSVNWACGKLTGSDQVYVYNDLGGQYLWIADFRTSRSLASLGGGAGNGVLIGSVRSDYLYWLLRCYRSQSPIGTGGECIFVVRCDNRVGVGTDSPSERFYVSGNISASGTITPGSDSRIKDSQKDISKERAFSVISNLKPKTWTWNEKADENLQGKAAAGLIAQDVKEVLPEAVTISDSEKIENFHSLNYNTIQGYELAAIKGLIEEVKSLKAEIVELKKQIK